VIRVLSRESKSNAILLGEAGVGKTAIAEGFAQKIADHTLGKLFENVRIVNLNLISILAAATTRGAIEDLLNGIIDEVKRSSNIILFIDEIHLITGGGNTSEASIISNILKPALARGELHVIGATTLTEYRKYIEKDPALSRRFEPIKVEEPNIENSIIICTESWRSLINRGAFGHDCRARGGRGTLHRSGPSLEVVELHQVTAASVRYLTTVTAQHHALCP
jgi:ATP-dependent Clp protease ATP-binding subunit ClpA